MKAPSQEGDHLMSGETDLVVRARASAEKHLRSIETHIAYIAPKERELLILTMIQVYLDGRMTGLQDMRLTA